MRSGRATCSRCATRGTAQKWRESHPHNPSTPLCGPAMVSCWHGDPATISRSAPGGNSLQTLWR
eukprot:12018585-Prorocentrum_lima.AAC.1